MKKRNTLICIIILTLPLGLTALPVSLGQIEIGLESYDGYQEGTAYISTNEEGTNFEILLGYKGFGLDKVIWLFEQNDFMSFREATANAAWWRSRLLELEVTQTVIRNAAVTTPKIDYVYRTGVYPFEETEYLLRFERQGKDYALLLTEKTPGAETRRAGEKIFPVFTIHFPGKHLPQLRDLVSEENVAKVLEDYAAQKELINSILEENQTKN